MKDRLKQIRKNNNLTQQEFADRLNIKRGTIANYELGRNEPIDAVITLISREFGINEEWLRTGEGQMKNAESEENEIKSMIEDALNGDSDFVKAVVKVICTRTKQEREILEKTFWDIVYNLPEKKKGQDGS